MGHFDNDYGYGKRSGGGFGRFLCMLLGAVVGAVLVIALAFTPILNGQSLLERAVGGNYDLSDEVETEKDTSAPEDKSSAVDIPIPAYDPDAEYDTVSAIATKLTPSVVGISNFKSYTDFFRGEMEMESTGTGLIISADGYIVTNNHVVKGANRLLVTLYGGEEVPATVVGTDAYTDLAVIRIEGENLPVASFGNSDSLRVGELAVAIGNPGGGDFANSVTKGIISGLDRQITTATGNSMNLIQTDAAINPGNSGGPLVNKKGEVIGINSIKIVDSSYEGMGFAIPSNTVVEITKQLMENGKVVRPALGVNIRLEVNEEINSYYHLGTDYGVLVFPQEDSAAEKAGMQDYDIITAIDGEKVETVSDLQAAIFSHDVGDEVLVSIVREGKAQVIRVRLGEG